MAKTYAIGVDIGGTNTRVAIVRAGGAGPRILGKCSVSTRQLRGTGAFVREIAEMTAQLLDENGVSRKSVRGVGVGAPGSVDVERGVVHFLPNVPGWKNVKLGAELRRKTGFAVRVDNDANAMAQGEFLFGAARGARNAIFVTLGTGVGGGLLINGKLFHGQDFSAAEIGHVRYRHNGLRCGCGARGCIETLLGNGYLLRQIEQDLARGQKTSIRRLRAAAPDKKIRLEMVAEAANNRDRYAAAFWRRTGEILGDFLASIANMLDPEIIVIGGGVAQAGPLLLDPARRKFRATAFPAAANAKIAGARFGADAGLIGAAGLVFAN